MCNGISILRAMINQQLFEEYHLERFIHKASEDAAEELRFTFSDRSIHIVLLPVIHDGQQCIYEWGNRGGKTSKLPATGWCRKESLEAGKWRWLKPEKVIIPANMGLEKGIWFNINEGIQGVVVRDEKEKPRVYIVTEEASTYFFNMTKHNREPVLINQVI